MIRTVLFFTLAMTLAMCADGRAFVASRQELPFHVIDCKWADNISPRNAEYYGTAEEAMNAGHVPCKECCPGYQAPDQEAPLYTPQRAPRPYLVSPPAQVSHRHVTFCFESQEQTVCTDSDGNTFGFYLPARLRNKLLVEIWSKGSEVDLWTFPGAGTDQTIWTAIPHQLDERTPFTILGRQLFSLVGWEVQSPRPGCFEMFPPDRRLGKMTVSKLERGNIQFVEGPEIQVPKIEGRLINLQPEGQIREWAFIAKPFSAEASEVVLVMLTTPTREDSPVDLFPVFEFWLRSFFSSAQ